MRVPWSVRAPAPGPAHRESSLFRFIAHLQIWARPCPAAGRVAALDIIIAAYPGKSNGNPVFFSLFRESAAFQTFSPDKKFRGKKGAEDGSAVPASAASSMYRRTLRLSDRSARQPGILRAAGALGRLWSGPPPPVPRQGISKSVAASKLEQVRRIAEPTNSSLVAPSAVVGWPRVSSMLAAMLLATFSISISIFTR